MNEKELKEKLQKKIDETTKSMKFYEKEVMGLTKLKLWEGVDVANNIRKSFYIKLDVLKELKSEFFGDGK